MNSDWQIWQNWVIELDRWGLRNITAWLLEAAGPILIIGAQLIYIGQPLLGTAFPASRLQALTDLMEVPEKNQAFITFLREDQQVEL